MNLAYRIYLGARNTESRRFSPRDLEIVEGILNEFFQGWTTARALGSWEGKTEETALITVTTRGVKPGALAPKAAVEACARKLKAHLGQESVLIEVGGATTFL